MHSMKRLLIFLLLLSTPLAGLAKPALWVASDADTTVYLFGTVHLLSAETHWRSPVLTKALTSSDALVLELVDDDPVTMTALVLRYGMDFTHPLSSKLRHSENVALDKAAKAAGLTKGATSLQAMKPWLAALTLTVTPLVKAGLDPALGVDKQLKAQMQKAGKPVRGLETAAEQIHLLADLPEKLQLQLLRTTVRDADKGTIELKKLIDAWEDGDVATIARLEDEQMRQQSPRLYQQLLVTRNQAWARKIATMMKQPGTLFIAVGAAHLAGPDSVQRQLKKLGIETQREPPEAKPEAVPPAAPPVAASAPHARPTRAAQLHP